ncbi:hypothetical protein [Salinicoccus carnicancri]|uniref:hypothetical protein n=1 Tax=Salinicoccus carnicancri TaxID=558170 RepID=UPI000319C6BD|nr:hypothetical protein [Salinicoccus carnicancri]
MTNNTKHLNPGLVLTLALIALIRPFMSITGISEAIGSGASVTATVLISIIWVAATVIRKEARPVLTLVSAGVAYAVFAVIISGVMSPILTGALQGPLTSPFAIISVLMTNIIWGFATGCIAAILLNLRRQ